MTTPRFLAALPANGTGPVDLPDDEAHHAWRVLRLGVGNAVHVFDGEGHEWVGTIAEIGATGTRVALIRPVEVVPEPAVEVTLAVGLLKAGDMDTVVRECTALGAAGLVPLLSARVVSPGRAAVLATFDRWRRIAIQSAKQSGRSVLPTLGEPVRFDDLLAREGYDLRVILVEPGPDRPSVGESAPPRPANSEGRPRVLVLVGPEGGWTAAEVTKALGAGVVPLRLGPRTLKGELAPTVVLASLWTAWGWT